MERVWKGKIGLDVTFEFEGESRTVDARRLLDPVITDDETLKLRAVATKKGILVDGTALFDEDESLVAKRVDYDLGSSIAYYFAFLCDFDEFGWPAVEPTIDDVPDEYVDETYKFRWEYVNNPQLINLFVEGVGTGVDSLILIHPDQFGSTFADNTELRRLAIEQGAFRPFPLETE